MARNVVPVVGAPSYARGMHPVIASARQFVLAQGRLLVASDVGGHKELIRDGETGVLFHAGDATSLGNAIVHLLAHREEWPRLREQGRRFVERERNWAASVALYRDVFGRLSPAAR